MPFVQHNRLDLTTERTYNRGCIEVSLLSFGKEKESTCGLHFKVSAHTRIRLLEMVAKQDAIAIGRTVRLSINLGHGLRPCPRLRRPMQCSRSVLYME
jgi:hypothetical protein